MAYDIMRVRRSFEIEHWQRFSKAMIEHFAHMLVYAHGDNLVNARTIATWPILKPRPGFVATDRTSCIHILEEDFVIERRSVVQTDFTIEGDESFLTWFCLKYF